MSKLVFDLIAQHDDIEGGFTLWDNGNAISLHKISDIIVDPFSANINRRDILTQLYSVMKQDALGEDMYMHTNKLLSETESGFRKIIDRQDPSIVSDSPDIIGMFKLLNIRFEVSDSLLSRICDYMDACHEYLKTRLFIFVNLKSFISESELVRLYNHSSYRKHILLLFENRQSKTIETEIIRVIDESLCEIRFSDEGYI